MFQVIDPQFYPIFLYSTSTLKGIKHTLNTMFFYRIKRKIDSTLNEETLVETY